MFLESAWLWPLLAGVVLLGSAEKELAVGQSPRQRWQVALALLLLVGALGVGLRGRGTPFWEAEQSLQQNVVSDESVYVSGARVWLQGHLPYRDFWLAHPPTGIAMLLPAAALGETAPEALLAARRTTALLDLCTALLIAWVAFRLGGLASAVIAAGLYLLDGIVAHHSALAFLETGLTFWSVAALGCALQGLHQDRPRWLVAAGALAALAASIKYTGSSLLVALLLVLVTTRRWRMVRALLLGSGAVGLLLALALLPLGWGNILRQTLLIHLLRPPAGIPSPERFMVAFNHVASVPTVLVGTLGVFALLFPRRLQHPGWAIVLFWLAFMLALFSRSHVFYGYYVPPLMAP
ncbi:MAG TPA: phospholipid carrier-dependent glycosyltransferase, partial [Myxococcaceae bacterium]|nr:phospholipid carrier-dependent glycosyltransferase [Myxococcaceae bacterium]